MRILVAGGSGVIGNELVPRIVAAGHDVVATTRREEKLPKIAEFGARGVVVDAFDAKSLAQAVRDAEPDAIIHEFTDLSEYDTEANARLRREGTANLVDAARSAGVERMIVQSVAWVFPDGDTPATEEDPIVAGTAVDAMEQAVLGLPHGTVLRYGMFYGPNTWYAAGGRIANAVLAGLLPATPAITSFVHIVDAVEATVESLAWPDGTYHIVDDEPAPGTEWLPVYADGLGAPQPPLAPLPDGASAGRPVSNAKARAIGWVPAHPTWRNGFPRI